MILTAIVFLLLLSVLVIIHELGHFLVAKKLKIKVEEFGFGFPPKAFGIKRGETVYSINWLPIGGFVKLYGEDEAGGGRIGGGKQEISKKDEERAFYTRSPWQRAAVVIAGVVMNALLAVVIFYVFLFNSNFKTELPLLTDHKFFATKQQNVNGSLKDTYITYVAPGSPAEAAGLLPHGKVLEINGEKVANRDIFIDMVNENKGKVVTIMWQDIRNGEIVTTKVTPRVNPPENQGPLGVGFPPTALLDYSGQYAFFSGVAHPLNLLSYTLDVMGKLVSLSFERRTVAPVSQGVSGPVGIYSLVGVIINIPDAKERFLQVLNLAGLLSISLAFFNILPIPALDGGRLFFILIEAITGKKVPQKFEAAAHSIGMAILLGLIVLITFKDLFQAFTKGFF